MTRFAAFICLGLALGLVALAPLPAQAQDSAADRCFPWQEFRGGVCVAKAAPLAPPPAETQPSSPPAPPERSETTAPPPPPAPSRALITITCIGGTPSNGQCACPAGFQLMPAGTDAGGTCVQTNAETCQGGALTVTGTCLCDGQVTMSGQVYDLEFSRGKCVPKRCPRDGPCVTAGTKPESDASPRLSSDEPEHARNCAKGMVATRRGCVPARHRSQTIDPGAYFRVRPNYSSPIPY